MDILKKWTAVRSGGGLSITHSTGKITRIKEITVIDGQVVALAPEGADYILEVADAVRAAADQDRLNAITQGSK